MPNKYVEVNFIDVGQGDSIHIKTSNYKNILIDCGGSEGYNYNVGKNILLPYLLNNSNGVIDAIFISHFHDDHAEGCIEVLKSLKVKKIYITPQPKKSYLLNEIFKLAKEKNVQIVYLKGGDVVKIDNVQFEVLFPNEIFYENIDLNNSSMILKAVIYNTSILFTGDAELKEEELLLEYYSSNNIKLDADILKIGHHGSKTSSSLEFLSLVTPKISIISCGIDNKFKHPHKETLEKLEKIGSKVYRTDKSGEISFMIYNNGKVKIHKQVL